MSIKPSKPSETPAEVRPEHFPQPNTIPGGWDLSGLMTVYNTPEMVDDSKSTPVDFSVAAELTEKYAL